MEHVDVLIVGAGLSGVGAACRLQQRCPGKSFAILEAREAIGGTWDLFRFPGARSDSDMFTLCYPFRPWSGSRAIVDGASILELHPRHVARARDRPAHPVRAPRGGRRVVLGRRALDRRGRARGRDGPADLRLPVHVHRLLPLRRGLHAGVRGHRALRRGDRAPAVLGRRHRIRRQARRRHRQRRDGRDDDPGTRPARRPRHDAPALAELHPLAAGDRPDRRPARSACCPAGSRIRSCAGRTC